MKHYPCCLIGIQLHTIKEITSIWKISNIKFFLLNFPKKHSPINY